MFTLAVVGASSYYAHKHRYKLDHMCCMMVGMIYSTIPGFAIGFLYAFFTGSYLLANVFGTIVGLIVGLFFSRIGDEFSLMEAVMGAVMGGLMGAMLGFMIRFEDKFAVLVFYYLVLALLAGESAYFIYKHKKKSEKECCN